MHSYQILFLFSGGGVSHFEIVIVDFDFSTFLTVKTKNMEQNQHLFINARRENVKIDKIVTAHIT